MINGSDCNEVTDEMRAWAAEHGRSPRIEKKEAPTEFIVGEWNKVDIICDGNHITTYVNGVLQNECTGFTYDNGYICLQSEGTPILFKNIWLKKLESSGNTKTQGCSLSESSPVLVFECTQYLAHNPLDIVVG